MLSPKQLKQAQRGAVQQQEIIGQLQGIAKDIARSEKVIIDLKVQLETVNAQYQEPRTTRQDVDYLSALLDCAKKKLAWEKQLASVQKRAPALLEQMMRVMNDPHAPPDEPTRAELLRSLKEVQAAMERLTAAQVGGRQG